MIRKTMRSLAAALVVLSALATAASAEEPRGSSLEVSVTHYADARGRHPIVRRITITKDNIKDLERSFGDSAVLVGYMRDLTGGGACYRGNPQEVIRDILKSTDVIDYYGDEECGGSTRVSADGRVILADCDNEDSPRYQVVVAPCGS